MMGPGGSPQNQLDSLVEIMADPEKYKKKSQELRELTEASRKAAEAAQLESEKLKKQKDLTDEAIKQMAALQYQKKVLEEKTLELDKLIEAENLSITNKEMDLEVRSLDLAGKMDACCEWRSNLGTLETRLNLRAEEIKRIEGDIKLEMERVAFNVKLMDQLR